VQREDGAVSEIEKLLQDNVCKAVRIAMLEAELDEITRQLRAEEITGLNVRLRTARECAEIAERNEECFSEVAAEIREKFGVSA